MTEWREIPGNRQVFDELVKLLVSGDAVAFVGAGASAGLYPLWPQLIGRLADAAIAAGMADESTKQAWCGSIDALEAARQIRRRLGVGTFAEVVREVFAPRRGADDKRYTVTHDALARLGFRAFVTTNYDPALTIACQEHRPGVLVRDFDWRHDRVALWLQGRGAADGELPILHAHGQYDASESLVIDAEDYRHAYGGDSYRLLFEQLWTRERLVIVGFGFSDPWLRIVVDEAVTRAGGRRVGGPRHVALIGLAEDDLSGAVSFREQSEDAYHARALFYPVRPAAVDGDGEERQDHSALNSLLEELVAATATTTAAAVHPKEIPAAARALAKPERSLPSPVRALPTPEPRAPLAVWRQQVIDEHRMLGDHFDRPAQLRLIEEAWVQVKVQPALTGKVRREGLAAEDHALLGLPTTLDEVLELPVGEPPWNTGRWLLEGPPGSGKTTLLRYLAARRAQHASADRVPLFVSLPRLVESGQDLLRHATDGRVWPTPSRWPTPWPKPDAKAVCCCSSTASTRCLASAAAGCVACSASWPATPSGRPAAGW